VESVASTPTAGRVALIPDWVVYLLAPFIGSFLGVCRLAFQRGVRRYSGYGG